MAIRNPQKQKRRLIFYKVLSFLDFTNGFELDI